MGSVLLAGLLTLVLGMVLGLVSLVTQKVTVTNRAPDPEALQPGSVIYVRGERGGRSTWRGKEQAWKTGQLDTLIVTETELNQWSEERFKQSAGEEETSSGWMDSVSFTVSPVNFRILEDKLQLATEVTFDVLMPNSPVVYQVTGRFESTPGGIRFVPETGNLGQAPLGSLPVTRDWLYSLVQSQFTKFEEAGWLVDTLDDLESVEISNGQMTLRRKAQG